MEAETLLHRLVDEPEAAVGEVVRVLSTDAAGVSAGQLVFLGQQVVTRNELQAYLVVLRSPSHLTLADRVCFAGAYLIKTQTGSQW